MSSNFSLRQFTLPNLLNLLKRLHRSAIKRSTPPVEAKKEKKEKLRWRRDTEVGGARISRTSRSVDFKVINFSVAGRSMLRRQVMRES